MGAPVLHHDFVTRSFSVFGYTFKVRGEAKFMTNDNFRLLEESFAEASEYLKLLSQGISKEQPLSIVLSEPSRIEQECPFSQAYYEPDDNTVHLSGEDLTREIVLHELNHAIDDFTYVDPNNPKDFDEYYASERQPNHPILLDKNQNLCRIPELQEFRDKFGAACRILRDEKRLRYLRSRFRDHGLRDSSYCINPQESVAVANYYTHNQTITRIREKFLAGNWEKFGDAYIDATDLYDPKIFNEVFETSEEFAGAFEKFKNLLESEIPSVRALAAKMLGNLGVPSVIPNLIRHLDDPDESTMKAAIEALSCFTDQAFQIVPLFVQIIKKGYDPSHPSRRSYITHAIRHMAWVGLPDPILSEILNDPDPKIHSLALLIMKDGRIKKF
ncbi:MAG TPA: hypothetical protein DDW49_02845 [Deltaproteobacteria bacterium]|nr:MAG: hypothetical protein A2048_02445 [Deltaproteobacteria bacterium GWA2_45_12]HBF12317.1 hypothetical protein [Deltaproteobacteria bacterium]